MPKDVNDKKEKKENKHFFKDFKAELKRVIWPTPKQLVNNTVAVITIVLITAVIVFALDFVFKTVDDYGINKLKEVIGTRNEESNTTTSNEETNNTNNNTTNETGNNTTNNETNSTTNNTTNTTNTTSNNTKN
ncbi:MAG: preprotein translocase subunit SecE [Clostridia bacterium]|nr:preprotein translocase subunit SecE [Clostridia bacterium]